MSTISVKELNVNHGNKEILKNINLCFEKGKLYGVLGPNGAGKSTLFDAVINQIKFRSGTIHIEDKELREYKINELAQKISLMSQSFNMKFPYTVKEVVAMGRYSYNNGRLDKEDEAAISKSIIEAKIHELKDRTVNNLSGGERQRVLFAKTLCQNTDIILIDEGFSNMDIYYEIEFIKLLKEKATKENKLIIFIMHDLLLARKYCDELVILKNGEVYGYGPSKEILDDKSLSEVFRVLGKFREDSLEII